MGTNKFARTRIDRRLKDDAGTIWATMGLSVLFLRTRRAKAVAERGVPFDIHMSNHMAAVLQDRWRAVRFKRMDAILNFFDM